MLNQSSSQTIILPFKSVAGALLFSVVLGPIGLLYASSFGGTLFIMIGLIAITFRWFFAVPLIWLSACIWSVLAVNYYNKMLLKQWLLRG